MFLVVLYWMDIFHTYLYAFSSFILEVVPCSVKLSVQSCKLYTNVQLQSIFCVDKDSVIDFLSMDYSEEHLQNCMEEQEVCFLLM